MSETAQSIITDALQEILVQADEQSMQPSEFQSGVRYLNRMMAQWAANGIELGYVDVVNPSDRITVLPGAIEAVITNLALKLAPQYDISPSPLLLLSAKESKEAALKLAYNVRESIMPSTLPFGTGNDDSSYFYDNKFYGPDEFETTPNYMKVGEIDSYSIDFSLYLLDGATITSYTVTSNQHLNIVTDVESSGIVTASLEAIAEGKGEVCFTVNTSTGRTEKESLIFKIEKPCNA